jgi:ribosomal protein L11 methyltransferase
MNTNWLEVTIQTTADGIDALSDYLLDCDVDGLSILDETDFQDFLAKNTQYWDYVDEDLTAHMAGKSAVTCYLSDDEHGRSQLLRIRDGLPALRERMGAQMGTLAVSLSGLKAEDWENNWKQYYKPLPAGEKLLIVPDWEREGLETGGRIPLFLNPGLTFGTGNHASTQLCLQGLEPLIFDGCRVLDLGCGSGILAIAALILGAGHAFAVDIDPKCVDVAFENAALNGFDKQQLSVTWGNVLDDADLMEHLASEPWDVVLANIVADVIIPLASLMPRLLKSGGHFLCSGVIDTRADEVRAAIEAAGLEIYRVYEKDGWVSFCAAV